MLLKENFLTTLTTTEIIFKSLFMPQVARRYWTGNDKAEHAICRAMEDNPKLKITKRNNVQDPSLLQRAFKPWKCHVINPWYWWCVSRVVHYFYLKWFEFLGFAYLGGKLCEESYYLPYKIQIGTWGISKVLTFRRQKVIINIFVCLWLFL